MSNHETPSPQISHEALQQTDVQNSEVAMRSLRRFITHARLAWNEQTLEDLTAHDTIVTQAPVGAQQIRGFGSTPQEHATIAKSPTEKIAALHREGQVRKVRKSQIEKFRISQVHTTQVPANEDIPSTLSAQRPMRTRTSVDARKWDQRRASLNDADRGRAASFDTSMHMKASTRRAVKKAEIRHTSRTVHIASKVHRLEKGARGESVPGKVRSWRINRVGKKIEKLQQRLRTRDTSIN